MAEPVKVRKVRKAKNKEPQKGRSLVGMILDKSGSMEIIRDDTIGSVNSYLDDLRESGQDHRITFFMFDTQVVNFSNDTPVADVERLNHGNYQPGGSTALNDAIMSCTSAIEKSAKSDDIVTIVIVTDGQENASREFPKKAVVLAKIAEYQSRGWNFIYLSASVSAFADGAGYGLAAHTISYTSTSQGVQAAIKTASSTTTRNYNAGGGARGSAEIQQVLAAAAAASPYLKYDNNLPGTGKDADDEDDETFF